MQLDCINMSREERLGEFLQSNFGVELRGASNQSIAMHPIEATDINVLNKEEEVVKDLRTKGIAFYGLDREEGRRFTNELGSYSMIQIAFPIRNSDGTPQRAFATLTPDGRLAVLGRLSQGSIWVPDNVSPHSRKRSMDDVKIYLSGANQLGTVGEHSPEQKIPIVDPRHLLNAMAEFNTGSHAADVIKSSPEEKRSHVGDIWEQDRKMLPIISAQDSREPDNDLIWTPITILPIYQLSQAAVFITREMVDEESLKRGRLVTSKADKKDALQSLQEMAFATLIMKRKTDELARKIEGKIV